MPIGGGSECKLPCMIFSAINAPNEIKSGMAPKNAAKIAAKPVAEETASEVEAPANNETTASTDEQA